MKFQNLQGVCAAERLPSKDKQQDDAMAGGIMLSFLIAWLTPWSRHNDRQPNCLGLDETFLYSKYFDMVAKGAVAASELI